MNKSTLYFARKTGNRVLVTFGKNSTFFRRAHVLKHFTAPPNALRNCRGQDCSRRIFTFIRNRPFSVWLFLFYLSMVLVHFLDHRRRPGSPTISGFGSINDTGRESRKEGLKWHRPSILELLRPRTVVTKSLERRGGPYHFPRV